VKSKAVLIGSFSAAAFGRYRLKYKETHRQYLCVAIHPAICRFHTAHKPKITAIFVLSIKSKQLN